MFFPDVQELFEYWGDYPPVHLALDRICQYLDIAPRKNKGLTAADRWAMEAGQQVPKESLPKYVLELMDDVAAGKA